MRKSLLSMLLLLLAAPAAWAQAPPLNTQYLRARLQAGMTLAQFLERARSEFRQADADEDGRLTEADEQRHAAMRLASVRAMTAVQWLRADADGDGAVTADEMRRQLRYDMRAQGRSETPEELSRIEQTVAEVMKADTDGDGRVTYLEAIRHVGTDAARFGGPSMSPLRPLMLFDADGDGVLTLRELEAAYEAFFKTVDSDGDGTISVEEWSTHRAAFDAWQSAVQRKAEETLQQRRLDERAREQAALAERRRKEDQERAACALPKASAAARVILLGTYQTEALSSVALGSQDKVTHAGELVIEPGAEPLYVVVTSYAPVIWRVTGAVDRIERLVVTSTWRSGPPERRVVHAGVTGLPAERISFVNGNKCLDYFNEVPSGDAAKAIEHVAREAGRRPDVIAARYDLARFVLPVGTPSGSTDGEPKLLIIDKTGGSLRVEGDARNVIVRTPSQQTAEADLRHFSPGGVMQIDASAVVAGVAAEPYEVLPGEAGLMQLMRSGALTRNRSGEYLIHRKIRYPAGLAGAHSVKFLLLRGVPEPDGDPGHSEVISEATGRAIEKKR